MSRALLAAVVVAGLLAGVGVSHLVSKRAPAPPELEYATAFREPRALPEFALVDQAGEAFGPARLRGQWTLVFFGFVNCPDICPTTLATLATVRKELADLPEADRPGVAFVSVDPGRDTPALVRQYVSHFDPAFVGATGSADDIEALTRSLGVAVLLGPADADGDYSVDHSAAVFLVDPDARVAALFTTPHEAGAIARDYRRIVAEG